MKLFVKTRCTKCGAEAEVELSTNCIACTDDENEPEGCELRVELPDGWHDSRNATLCPRCKP